jgi:hypothetical protein
MSVRIVVSSYTVCDWLKQSSVRSRRRRRGSVRAAGRDDDGMLTR